MFILSEKKYNRNESGVNGNRNESGVNGDLGKWLGS